MDICKISWSTKFAIILVLCVSVTRMSTGQEVENPQPVAVDVVDTIPRPANAFNSPPNMLAIDPPRLMNGGIFPQPLAVQVHGPMGVEIVSGGNPVQPGFQTLQNGHHAVSAVLGMVCWDNSTCRAIPNSFCINNTCQCLLSFMEDPLFPGTCRLAPGYNEPCNGGEIECRAPFACNSSNFCDCPEGYIQEYFQCVRNCPSGMIPVEENCHTGKQLEERCEVHEQCVQSYAQCLHGKCQCIPGANQIDGKCFPVNQCPLGEPATGEDGELLKCKSGQKYNCPKDFYCLYPEFAELQGFCCPKIKMNCPIGKPLEGRNCTNCPWETHHCFSYVIGSYTETMCCPNACPASQPIQKDGQCYARSAFAGNCMVNEQCYNVVGAVCRESGTEQGGKQCLCPKGNFQNYFGKCMRVSILGEQCSRNEECKVGSNTVCLNKICSCYQGYMPEPLKTASRSPEKCIAEPSCPTAKGVQTVEGSYEDCSENPDICNADQYCRKWWYDGNKTFSLCCPEPRLDDYQAICQPFRMTLLLTETHPVVLNSSKESSDPSTGLAPLHCDIIPFPQPQAMVPTIPSPPQFCPIGSSCIFDPFSVNKGVCCQPAAAAAPPKVNKPSGGPNVVFDRDPKPATSNKELDEKIPEKPVAPSVFVAGEGQEAEPKQRRPSLASVVQVPRLGIPIIRVRPRANHKSSDLDLEN